MTVHPRWVGVGESAEAGSGSAGAQARAAALAGREDAKLLIVFASAAHDLEALLQGIAPGDIPLVGCSTTGEIGCGGRAEPGVVVMALGGEGFAVQTALATGVGSRLRAAGADVATSLHDLPERAHRTLLVLSDAFAGDPQEIVRGAYDVTGAVVPLVGGCAGAQLHGTSVLENAVVGVAIGSDAPLGVGVEHGWRRVGEPVLVSKSAGHRVLTLDDRPALDVYLERLDAPQRAYVDPAAFARFALTHPLALGRRGGEDHVRFIGEADFLDRSLGCIAEIPQGAIAWLMEGDAGSVLEATGSACDGALQALDAPPLGVLAFDCVARRGVLGDDGVAEEAERIRAACSGSPMAGFSTYGGIARTRGVSGVHNQTLVVLALG